MKDKDDLELLYKGEDLTKLEKPKKRASTFSGFINKQLNESTFFM